ncbi:hypothetical protein [Polyangium mundeleinium]|uniref:Uncharacterized protein n=1 Tax=Polyangium mundeleinium TaxID=2995306 RepID=A0ABT5F4A4_9BACT|nr:hypothetical protein [Polyangium mundeleinium]MDC0748924.1 hypothetical protein [Polyangium mundeleinium]
MSGIDYKRFHRVLTRSEELGVAPDARQVVSRVYADVLKAAAAAFLGAHKSVVAGESAAGKEGTEAAAALESIDRPYREARAVALAYVPTLRVPDTLKRQPTDTDKMTAIEALLDAIDDHVGSAWADDIVNGEFGKLAPQVVKEINESIDANKDLANAKQARAAAYGPAYEKYLAFKRVVRAAHGPASKEYKRIHLRASGAAEDDGAEG